MRSIFKTNKLSHVETEDLKRKLKQQGAELDQTNLISQVNDNDTRRSVTRVTEIVVNQEDGISVWKKSWKKKVTIVLHAMKMKRELNEVNKVLWDFRVEIFDNVDDLFRAGARLKRLGVTARWKMSKEPFWMRQIGDNTELVTSIAFTTGLR